MIVKNHIASKFRQCKNLNLGLTDTQVSTGNHHVSISPSMFPTTLSVADAPHTKFSPANTVSKRHKLNSLVHDCIKGSAKPCSHLFTFIFPNVTPTFQSQNPLPSQTHSTSQSQNGALADQIRPYTLTCQC